MQVSTSVQTRGKQRRLKPLPHMNTHPNLILRNSRSLPIHSNFNSPLLPPITLHLHHTLSMWFKTFSSPGWLQPQQRSKLSTNQQTMHLLNWKHTLQLHINEHEGHDADLFPPSIPLLPLLWPGAFIPNCGAFCPSPVFPIHLHTTPWTTLSTSIHRWPLM